MTLKELATQLPKIQEEAKALWGEGGGGISQGGTGELGWWNHLQNLAVSSDPIKYLEDNNEET